MRRPARPLPKTSEEMKAWSLALASELSSWPEVASRPMFGMMAFYRGDRIFACLPHKRAFYERNTVIFKFDPLPQKLAERAQKDSRISGERALTRQKGWFEFAISNAKDLRDVLWWFNEAHRAARLQRPPSRRNSR